jgi:hypothetical protein
VIFLSLCVSVSFISFVVLYLSLSLSVSSPLQVQERYFETVPTDAGATPVSGPRYRLRKDCIRTGDTQFRRRRIEDIVGAATGGPDGRFAREPHHTTADYAQFLSLIQGLLQYDPIKRIRATEGLKHPFITMSYRGGAVVTAPAGALAPQPGQAAAAAAAAAAAGVGGTVGDSAAGARTPSKTARA